MRSPPRIQPLTPEEFRHVLPLACAWAKDQEKRILEQGEPLTPAQVEDAKLVGVREPARVRFLRVEDIPIPRYPAIRTAAEATGLISPLTAGLPLRHGIFIRSDCWGQRRLVVHELAHTAQ